NADDAVGRGHAGHATRDAWEHQANSTVAGTRGKIGDTIIAVSRDNAGDTCTRRQCQARKVPLADAGCNADDALGRNCATPPSGGRGERKPSPLQTPAATPTTPSAAVTPAAPSPALGGSAKPATLPPQTPAAKPSAPTTPSAAITPGAQSSANKPATSPPQVPAAKPPAPSALPAPTKPIIASPSPPPAGVAKPATPSPHIPAASPPPPAKPI